MYNHIGGIRMIKFVDVSKTYEDSDTHALNNITLDIEDGEFVFIVGSSGAGKSTLLKLIMREQIPTSGDIIVDDQVINKLPRKDVPFFRRKMGMVYQDFRLIDKMNVFENIAFAMRVIGKSQSEIKPRVKHILKLVGLEHKINVRPSQLSGGEQQRVSLARAIVNKPKIVIADEPTANVDAEMSREIIKLLKKINNDGTTVLVVTHDKEIVNEVGGRIVEIKKGRVVSDSGPKKALSDDDVSNSKPIQNNYNTADDKQNDISLLNKVKPHNEQLTDNIQTVTRIEGDDTLTDNNCPKTCDESTGQDAESTNLKDDLSQDVLDVTKYDSLIQEIKAEQIKKSAEQ